MFKIDRRKSNRIINSIKYISFAGLLALTKPIGVSANDINNSTEIQVEANNSNKASKIKKILMAIPFIYIIVVDINVYNETIREEEKISNERKKVKKKDSE